MLSQIYFTIDNTNDLSYIEKIKALLQGDNNKKYILFEIHQWDVYSYRFFYRYIKRDFDRYVFMIKII